MRTNFGKYQIKGKVRTGDRYVVYLGQHLDLRKYYFLKVEELDYPSQQRSAVSWEFDLLKHSDVQSSLRPIQLLEEGHQRIGVYEFRNTISLKSLVEGVQRARFVEQLELAIRILKALHEVHGKQICVGDLSPDNVLIDRESKDAVFIDFSKAQAPQNFELRRLPNPLSEAQLPYISPEQSGRLKRQIDHRSDLYSAGILLYQMFTGYLPFQCQSVSEYIHHHLAVTPAPMNQKGVGIPDQIDRIVSKLIEKDPDQRYNSAYGAAFDLESCLATVKLGRTVDEFILGTKDVSDRLMFPKIAIGRSTEVKKLKVAFEPFTNGQSSVILLAGNSGIGKSTLIEEMKSQIKDERILWITSSFHGNHAVRPFEGIVRAFGGLIKRLLTLDEHELTYWRNIFTDALGTNAQLVIRLIPELELILGKQIVPPELGPLEEQSRFELTFRQFLRSFTHSGHKIVLVLDDIQWLDEPSFHVIKSLMQRDQVENFMLIGSYKTDCHEVSFELSWLATELKSIETNFNFVRLGGLNISGITEFLCQTFSRESHELDELALIIQEKTRGNPFFIKEFIKRAHEREDIYFKRSEFRWQWNPIALQNDNITDNTVAVVIEEINSLGPDSIKLIGTAACLGTRFRLDDLILVADLEARDLKEDLFALCRKGLIMPNNEVSLNLLKFGNELVSNAIFTFSHPRIHQAASSILDGRYKIEIRHRLGFNQLKNFSKEQIAEHIYDIVDNFSGIQADSALKVQLAELNLIAGKKARRSGSFDVAMQYLKASSGLLRGEKPWLHHYDLTLKLFREIALTAFLRRDPETMDFAVVEVMRNARHVIDTVAILEVKIQETMTRDMIEAIRIAEHVMKSFGVKIPTNPSKISLAWRLGLLMLRISRKNFVEQLASKPKTDNPILEAGIRIGCKVGSAAYLAMPNLTPILVGIAITKGLKHGHVSSSAFAYAGFGIVLTGFFKQFDRAHELGQFALQLAKSYREKDQICRVEHMVNSFIRPWKEPINQCLPALVRAFRIGVESGEFEFACHSINIYAFYAFFAGSNLHSLDDELQKYRNMLEDLNQKHLNLHTEMYRQGVLNLQTGSAHTVDLEGESFQEGAHQAFIEQTRDFAFYHSVLKLVLAYHFKEFDKALELVKDCQRNEEAARGSYAISVFLFFEALTKFECLSRPKVRFRFRIEMRILKIIKLFAMWSKHIDVNFKHRLQLLQAEWWRYRGQTKRAMALYQSSYDWARFHEFAADQALIAERFSEYLAQLSLVDLAGFYRKQSVDSYQQWGASKKAERLAVESEGASNAFRNLQVDTYNHQLDMESMIRALSEMADETNLDSLKSRIVASAMTFAGADRAHLILKNFQTASLDLAQSSIADWDGLIGLPITECQDICHSVINFVKRTLGAIVVDDAQLPSSKIPGLEKEAYISRSVVRSLACIPLIIRDGQDVRLVGMIYLENKQAAHVFSRDRFQILEMIGQTAAARLDLSLKANSLEASLKEAQLVQQALLPSKMGTEHFTVGDYYRSAEHAGGDWFGFYEDRKRGRLYFLLGDVTGHGVSSSLVTGTAAGSAYSSLATMEYSSVDHSLEESIRIVAAAVNRAVYATAAKVSKMMTMVFVGIEADSGYGVYISAGHPAGCIISHNKNTLLKPSGSPLGYRHDPIYQIENFQMHPGDSLFFYTDGLFENRGPDGRMLKLRHVLKRLDHSASPEENRDLILQMGRAIWREQHPEDDCAFVLIQWHGRAKDLELEKAS